MTVSIEFAALVDIRATQMYQEAAEVGEINHLPRRVFHSLPAKDKALWRDLACRSIREARAWFDGLED